MNLCYVTTHINLWSGSHTGYIIFILKKENIPLVPGEITWGRWLVVLFQHPVMPLILFGTRHCPRYRKLYRFRDSTNITEHCRIWPTSPDRTLERLKNFIKRYCIFDWVIFLQSIWTWILIFCQIFQKNTFLISMIDQIQIFDVN